MSSLFAFPGQGAQQVGMLQRLPEGCGHLLEEASDVLGQQVLGMDSQQALQNTRAVQLCLLLSGVAWARWLMQRSPSPDYVAGLSIGAYPAAVVAGALGFADAVRLVALRGELMQGAYPQGYGMTALSGLDLNSVERLLIEVGGEVYVANLNSENQIVIAGSDAAMAEVAARARRRGQGVARRLAVSVPSHCPLLDRPAAALADAFATVELQRPRIMYLSGSSARPVYDPQRLRDDLAGNMARVVDWRATLRNAYERGVRLHLEMPPGSVLSGLARPVFEQGRVVTVEGTRWDTLDALLRQEVAQNR
ncbi:malonyl CoA-acyl carrier protein transacylase [Pseudomonas putida]|uniref:Malonyl CoA-acyl carrier protein transacylase n=1 Tax=Pseudomonas putida TaxID=303 RepID=A0AA37R8D0_PSEPU|nr:malonate decarboxylase subunit epsilon [Pseudomonas putida]GLO15142.1 malonyl CoA-acyl carrier protein transacylase [Pseudomonas putida]GLO37347.1 malonyl CoA-acyl carrier protein transacylase [Pseudomonas putida]HDS0964560.1 malonate decarboxylase subunit epsilon [Pseudomonas putida]HDS0990630.1 malonate decarboxylase subunit epsilon [Pseudomonas putida]